MTYLSVVLYVVNYRPW